MFGSSRKLRFVTLVLGASVVVAFASTGCVSYYPHPRGPGVYTVTVPPLSAPQGYVHYYNDVALVFDRSWNGYWVRGHPHHYFQNGHYYRWRGNRWYTARDFRGPWVSIALRGLPVGLHQRVAKVRRNDYRNSARNRRYGYW
jgi:hypothetical protein